MKKVSTFVVVLLLVISCKKEIQLNFSEHSIESSKNAIIALNFPMAEGTKSIANAINQILEAHISSQINLSEDDNFQSLEQVISEFNSDYNEFINDFPDSSQKWEALVDGEVTYQSTEVISIAMNTYLDTGGAHGNTNVVFFNFDPNTGKQLTTKDLISDTKKLSDIIKSKLKSEINENANEPMENLFFGSDFKLPESLGYGDEGLIILYNPYEIASYAQGIIEFTISFEEAQEFMILR